MEQFIIDNLKRNQEEIDDLLKDTTIDTELKDKLLGVLNEEKNMFTKLREDYDSKENS